MHFNENDQDIGEVGEWVEHRANAHDDNDDEFDVFDNQAPKVQSFFFKKIRKSLHKMFSMFNRKLLVKSRVMKFINMKVFLTFFIIRIKNKLIT